MVLFAVRYSRSGKTRDALLAGLFFVLAFAACGYPGLFALVVLPPAFLVLLWGRWRLLPRVVMATVLAGLALLPLYLMHGRALGPEEYARGAEETIQYSARLLDGTGRWGGNMDRNVLPAPYVDISDTGILECQPCCLCVENY